MDLRIEFRNNILLTESERSAMIKFFKELGYVWYGEGSTLEPKRKDRVFDMAFDKKAK